MKMKICLLLLTLLPGISFAMKPSMFLDIPEIKGESEDSDHEEWIDILRFSWGGSSDGRSVCIEDVQFTKFLDAASPHLMMAMAEGTVFPEIRFEATKATGNDLGGDLAYIKYFIRGATVSSVSTGGGSGEDRMTEDVTVKFDELQYIYTPQGEDGGGAQPREAFIYPQNGCK